mgnify:CR=1 FL=1
MDFRKQPKGQDESFDYQVGNCRLVCNPRGYMRHGLDQENKRFNPELVVRAEVELSHRWLTFTSAPTLSVRFEEIC